MLTLLTILDKLDNFKVALPVIWKGWLGVFVVTAIIIIVVLLLNKISNRQKKEQ